MRASVWWDLPARPDLSPRAPLDGVHHAHSVVIGGGIAGQSVAHALASRGDDVLLVERHHPAAGATGRNAGFLLADSECVGLAARMHGLPAALALRDIGLRSRAFVHRIAATAPHRAGLVTTGSIRFASDRVEAASFAATPALLQDPRGTPRVHSPQDVEEPWRASLIDDGDGVIDPLLLIDALIAASANVRRFDGTEVTAITRRRGGVSVTTPAGTVHAARVIVATNADARRLVPHALPRVRPVRAQAMAAWIDPAPRWPRPAYANRGGEYWRLLADGRALLGGLRRVRKVEENTNLATPNPALQRALDQFLRGLVGPAARIEVTHRWAGIMGFTRDAVPVAGRVAGGLAGRVTPNIHILAGFNGHGMGWAPGLADLLAAHLENAAPALPKMFRPGR